MYILRHHKIRFLNPKVIWVNEFIALIGATRYITTGYFLDSLRQLADSRE
jgi:hypothetical protein